MDRLDENLKRIMQVASVIGRDFAYRILQTITGMQEELKGHLVNLQGLEFIYEKSLYPELEYVFKHALTQEVAYNSLLLKRRKQIHERIGKAIEELYPDRQEEFCEALAHHYSTAENWEKAFQYLRMSAEKAHRSYATQEAFNYYREALSTLGRLRETEQGKRDRLDIMHSMAHVMVALNFPEGSLEILKESLSAAEELGDRAESLTLYGMTGIAYSWAGNHEKALEFNQKAFDEAEALGDETAMSRTAMHLCNAYLGRGEPAPAADVAARAIAMLERTQRAPSGTLPAFDTYATLLSFLGWAKGVLGDFSEGDSLCQKAISVAAEINSQYNLAMAHLFYSIVLGTRTKADACLYHAKDARRLSEEAQIPSFLPSCSLLEAWGYYYQGDLLAAREYGEKAITLLLELGPASGLPNVHGLLGMVSQGLGDLPDAQRHFEQGLKLARDHASKGGEGWFTMLLGKLIIEEDPSQIAVAEQKILKGLKMREDLQTKPLQAEGHLALGEVYAIAGQKKKALASLNKAHQMFQEMGMDYYLAKAEEALEKLKV